MSTMPQRSPSVTLVVVTGATGYIAAFIVKLALEQGYRVRGTVRSLSSEEKLAHLRAMEGAEERLELVEANLMAAETFPSVMAGANVLLHTATPIVVPDADDMYESLADVHARQIDPAVEGTKALFKAAADAGVAKIVLTSSIAAMINQNPPPAELNAEEWSDIELLESSLLTDPVTGYKLAKTLQERAAWELAATLGVQLAVINPFLVIGPRLTPSLNLTNAMVMHIAQGKGVMFQPSAPGTIPDGFLGIVDVREVAEAHILAMKDINATGRYLLQGHNVHYADVVRVLRESNEAYAQLPETPIDTKDGKRHAGKAAIGFDNSPARALGVAEIQWEDSLREVAAHTADAVSATAPASASLAQAASNANSTIRNGAGSLVGSTPTPNAGGTLMVVTGATGYIAAYVVKLALERGYRVRGTVRSLADETKLAHLRTLPGAQERLELVVADLKEPATFPSIMVGAHVLLHTATPIDVPDEDHMFKTLEEVHDRQIDPAVEGTKALLEAAAEARVPKIVLTSSCAAMFAQNPPPTELNADQWSDLEMLEGSLLQAPPYAYFYAKTLQEKVAREMAAQLNLKLATICPYLVIGPRLTPELNASNSMLAELAQGKGIILQPSAPGKIPDGFVGIVDVREVAEAHILAAENLDATGRYLLQAHNVHYADVIRVMREADAAFDALPETPLDTEDGKRHVDSAAMGFDNGPTRALGVSEIPWEDSIREAARTSAGRLST